MTRSQSDVSVRARRVWDRLSEWYGTRIAETYGPNPPRDWCRLVDRSTDFDIKRALGTIRTKHPSHPPTLPEFEAALRPPPPVHRDATKPTVQEQLVAHVTRNYRLTTGQLVQHWTFLYERMQWTDKEGRQRDELARCVGVWIPSCGEADGFRVPTSDLTEADAA